MKSNISLVLVYFISLFSLAETATLKTSKGTVKLKNELGTEVEYSEKEFKDKKFEVQLTPSMSIQKAILDGKFQVKIIDDKNEYNFDVDQSRASLKASDGTEQEKVIYSGHSNQNDKINIACYESMIYKEKDSSEKSMKMDCIKKSGCKSYAVKDSKTFELKETPICIGKAETKYLSGARTFTVTCKISVDNDNLFVLSQVIDTRNDVVMVKKSESCQ